MVENVKYPPPFFGIFGGNGLPVLRAIPPLLTTLVMIVLP